MRTLVSIGFTHVSFMIDRSTEVSFGYTQVSFVSIITSTMRTVVSIRCTHVSFTIDHSTEVSVGYTQVSFWMHKGFFWKCKGPFNMGWLRLVGSLKLQVSFAKEPYKRDYVLHKRPIILRRLLIVATPYLQSPLKENIKLVDGIGRRPCLLNSHCVEPSFWYTQVSFWYTQVSFWYTQVSFVFIGRCHRIHIHRDVHIYI